MKSNLRVTVQFKDSAVFAGEELACIITFRNVAPSPVSNPRPRLIHRPSSHTPPASAIPSARRLRPSLTPVPPPAAHSRRQSSVHISVGHNDSIHARTRSSVSAVVGAIAPTTPHSRSLSVTSLHSQVHSPTTSRPLASSRQPSIARGQSPSAVPGLIEPADDDAKLSPRSSFDAQHLSSPSQETLTSEAPQLTPRTLLPLRDSCPEQATEHLMMAYAQVQGSFTLDGSLIDQAPFEDVKLQDVMRCSGAGGVVGIESSKANTFFGAFGWSALGDSLGGVMGKDEKSTLKELRSSTDQKIIPLLSTPQSLLFVDLKLGPGQEKSCGYSFRIPAGLTPSHRGRAIKVQYNLRIGVQKPGNSDRKHTSTADAPFRVLGSVNPDGEILGHDLMSPYILLRDEARTVTAESVDLTDLGIPKPVPAPTQTGLSDFLTYTTGLLYGRTPNDALISPTATMKQQYAFENLADLDMKARVDQAIARSNLAAPPSASSGDKLPQASNRFVIVKGLYRIGELSLLRPAYRIGERIIGTVDFSPDDEAPAGKTRQTYSVVLSLETTERIDTSLALRSASSIQRATRKVIATATYPTLFARRVGFVLEIPFGATPSFVTTGVSLEWRLRVGFCTQDDDDDDDCERDQDAEKKTVDDGLLRVDAVDEQGTTLVAREDLDSESFDVLIPLRVFGSCDAGVVGGRDTGKKGFGSRELEI